MDPNATASHAGLGGLLEDELYAGESLNEFDVEDLLGHDIDFEEHDDWRLLDY